MPVGQQFCVLGGGSFGLGIAHVLANKGIATTVVLRKEETAKFMNTEHRHPRYLSDLTLNPTIFYTADHKTALQEATYIVHAVPVQFTRDYLKKVRSSQFAGTLYVARCGYHGTVLW